MDYNHFTREWLKRANRKKTLIDDADRFISLWIAFNGWLKKTYGEDTRDKDLIERVKKNKPLQEIFEQISCADNNFKENLTRFMEYSVIDMRDSSNEQKEKRCNGDYKSFMDTIYQIRCNLFHGRKNFEENKKDIELITLSLKLLRPLFSKILENDGVI